MITGSLHCRSQSERVRREQSSSSIPSPQRQGPIGATVKRVPSFGPDAQPFLPSALTITDQQYPACKAFRVLLLAYADEQALTDPADCLARDVSSWRAVDHSDAVGVHSELTTPGWAVELPLEQFIF